MIEDAFVEFDALGFRGGLEEVENGQGELAFDEIRAEGFADDFFGADEV